VITFTYKFAQTLSFLYFKLFHRINIIGIENIPISGPFILASNHLSFLDPPAVGCKVNRNLHYFARSSLFVGPLGFLIRRLNSIPVNRDQLDFKTLKTTLKVLKDGHPLLVFPEGTRSLDGKISSGKKGIGLLVKKSKCPVFPVRIRGTFEILGKGKIFPRIGRKICLSYGKELSYEDLTAKCEDRSEIYDLISERVIRAIKKL
jgi:1-acyl-sn-glycerol-3-phosphate acyltransferase